MVLPKASTRARLKDATVRMRNICMNWRIGGGRRRILGKSGSMRLGRRKDAEMRTNGTNSTVRTISGGLNLKSSNWSWTRVYSAKLHPLLRENQQSCRKLSSH